MTPEQQSFFWAILLKPFAFLAFAAFFLGIRFAVIKYMPEGKLKRLFLIRVNQRWHRRSTSSTSTPKSLN